MSDDVANMLIDGKVGIIRTDTIYGIIGRADNEETVERIFDIKGRSPNKPPIVLIAEKSHFFDQPNQTQQKILDQSWPGKISFIIESPSAPFWIERGSGQVAYRFPGDEQLQKLILKTGPLVAPSANPQNLAPAASVQAAIDYFGDQVDFFVDGGEVIDTAPSQLVSLDEHGTQLRLR